MKKVIFILVTMLSFAIGANAQYNVSGHKFFDNWSVGTDAGVTTNFHDWDTPNGGVWGVQLTKGITPVFSLEFSTQLGFNNNNNWNVYAPFKSSNVVDNVNVLGSAKVNLMNWFCGYNGTPRLFEVQVRAGAGYMRGFYPDYDYAHGTTDCNWTVGKVGADFDFNVGCKKAWTLSLRPAIIFRGQNGVSECDNGDCAKYTHNAVGQITVGVTYHFKTSNGRHSFSKVEPEVVTNIVEKIVREKEIVRVPERRVVEKETLVQSKFVVTFAYDNAELTDIAKAELDKVKGTVEVKAYASPEGGAEYNKELSQRRANAVAEYLKAHGVNVVEAVGLGATGEDSNRVAIVTVK